MENGLLTPRSIYMLLAHGNAAEEHPITFLSPLTHYTLTHFWWAFLSECVPDHILTPYFETSQKRSRALSNLMNRSAPRSMPVRLYHALEEHLTVEGSLTLIGWMAAALDQNVHPQLIHDALDEMEDRLFPTDYEADRLAGAFRGLRPIPAQGNETDLKKLRLQAALRLTLLGLHALYGDHMNESAALNLLRSSRICHIDTLWTMLFEYSPRIGGEDLSHVMAATRANRPFAEASGASAATLLAQAEALFRNALPPDDVRAGQADETAGWYIVANWTDLSISVNTHPRPSYDGGVKLGELENGMPVYVLSAPGYRGLHVSANVWGKIMWNGRLAYIPMNLMVKLKD